MSNPKGIFGVCRFCGGDAAGRRTACWPCQDWYIRDKNTTDRPISDAERCLLMKKALQSFGFNYRDLLSPQVLERYESHLKKTNIN